MARRAMRKGRVLASVVNASAECALCHTRTDRHVDVRFQLAMGPFERGEHALLCRACLPVFMRDVLDDLIKGEAEAK